MIVAGEPVISASYDIETKTFSVRHMSARDAHVLIWGGTREEIGEAEERLRQALVRAEDDEMPDKHYQQFNG